MAATDPFAGAAQADPFAAVAHDASDPFAEAAQSVAPAGPAVTKPVASPAGIKPYVPDTKYGDLFEQAGREMGVDPLMLRAIHAIEDPGDNPAQVSIGYKPTDDVGHGLQQIKPSTFADYDLNPQDIYDPKINIAVSAKIVRDLQKRYPNDPRSVFAAYNQGPGNYTNKAGQAYADQALANLAFLQSSLAPKAHSTLSKGAQNLRQERHELQGLDKELDKAAGFVYNVPGALVGKAWDHLPDDLKKTIEEYKKTGLAKDAAQAAGTVLNLANVPIEALNAAMRDMATGGKTGALAGMGKAFMDIVQDPKKAGDILARLADQYGENSKDEILFWSQQPGMSTWLQNVKAGTPEASGLQELALMHADMARYLATHDGERDLMAAVVGLLNPGNRIPGLLLKATGFGIKSGAKALAGAIDKHPLLREAIDQHVNDPAHKFYTSMPMGDRYHDSYRAAGSAGANAHFNQAVAMARTGEVFDRVFRMANKLGLTSPQQRVQIWRAHDRFFNDHETYHIDAPPNMGALTHIDVNPVSKTLTMKNGPTKSTDYATFRHKTLHANVPARRLDPGTGMPVPTKVKVGGVRDILPPPDVDAWGSLTAGTRYSQALQLHPGISAAEADAFEQAIKADPMFQNKQGGIAWANDMAYRRLLAAHAEKAGIDAVDDGEHTIFFKPLEAAQHDDTMINGMTADERMFYTARSIQAIDEGVRILSPTTAVSFLEGFWPRSGAFINPDEAEASGMTLSQASSPGGTAFKPGNPQRDFLSIREAEEVAGYKINPEFDPAVPLESAMKRSLNFQNYVRFALQHGEPIDYAEVAKAGDGQWESDEMKSLMNSTPVTDPNTGVTTYPHMGSEGRKRLSKAVDAEVDARHLANTPTDRYNAETSPANAKNLQAEKDKQKIAIYQALEKAWTDKHPGMVFRTDDELGVPDLSGITIPNWVRDANIDSHPALNKQGKPQLDKILAAEPPETPIINALEGLSHVLRTIFMLDPTYHQRVNLSWIGVAFSGRLNPVDIARLFFAPNSIDPAIHDAAAAAGAHTPTLGSFGTAAARIRSAYASSIERDEPEKNLFKRQVSIPQRISKTIDAYKNVNDPTDPWAAKPLHILHRAAYQVGKWNQDLTFKVWEDATASLIWKRLTQRGMSAEEAGRETRKLLGDSTNITRMERIMGIRNSMWFFSWIKTQMRLAASQGFLPRALAAENALHSAISSQNQNDGSQDPNQLTDRGQVSFKVGDKMYDMTVRPSVMTRLNAVNALASTPFTQGEGFMDFGQYMTSAVAYSLDPRMKIVFQVLPQMFGQGYTNQDSGALLQEAAPAIMGVLAPPQAKALAHGMSEPVRYLELLGVPVINEKTKEQGSYYTMLAKKLLAKRNEELYMASQSGSATLREEIHAEMDPDIQRYLRMAADAYGR